VSCHDERLDADACTLWRRLGTAALMFQNGLCQRGHDVTQPGTTILIGKGRPRQNCRRCYTLLRLRYLIQNHYLHMGMNPMETTAAALSDMQTALRLSRP
jgi:hypothetical protein